MGRIKPIIFILGPSGVGKSYLSKKLAKSEYQRVPIDTDRKSRTFAANGFPSEWDNDFHKVNVANLVSILRDRLDNKHTGVVITFPTVYIFTPVKLNAALQLGVTPVVLWGEKRYCVRAAKMRIEKKGGSFDSQRYDRLNDPTFQAYDRPEYNDFRVETFQEDGSRYPDTAMIAQIIKRAAG